MEDSKPTIEEVLEHAKKTISYWIRKKGSSLPQEHKDEIEQIAMVKLLEKYPEIEADRGWKSLTSTKCRGIVLDFIKQGTGFEDDSDHVRVETVTSDGDDISVDQILGSAGVFENFDPHKVEIKWELVSKMASVDLPLRAFAMQLLGVTLKNIGKTIDVEVARADQLVKEFIARFDDPEEAENEWFMQTCYAFGICELLGMPNEPIRITDKNAMIAEHLVPIDLYDQTPCYNYKLRTAQMGFNFDADS